MRNYIDRGAADFIFAQMKRPPSSYFFVDRPGFNRQNGRSELIYDHWLYPVFERLKLADHRSRWLLPALTSGPVRSIVHTSDYLDLGGIEQSLPDAGYRPDVRAGPFFVWSR
jgi:hypothetical protein